MTDTAKPDMRAKLTCDHGKWERHLVSWVNNTPATEAIWCGGATLLESSDIILIRKVDGEWPPEAIEEMEEIVARYYIASAQVGDG